MPTILSLSSATLNNAARNTPAAGATSVALGDEDGDVLLDMGDAEPERFAKADVAMVRLRVEF